jgi:putative phage-type endonuclease
MDIEMRRMRNRVKALQKRPQPAQRSELWYQMRTKVITASEAASCLVKCPKVCDAYVQEFELINYKYKENEPVNPYETREDYIIKKCASYFGEHVFQDSVHTLWGKKYEEVANRLYCQLNNVKVIEFGLVPHGRIRWLAASPDGITEDGIMLEIKCPKSRKINQGCPPMYYWVQTQIQLEVCNLDACDFLECEIVELEDEATFTNKAHEQGIDPLCLGIVLKIGQGESGEPQYIYPPLDIRTPMQHIEWKNSILTQEPSYIPTYYYISKHNTMRIRRSREWFNGIKDDLKQAHDIVMNLQRNKEHFIKYKETMDLIKNKEYWDRYHTTHCEIEDLSTYVHEETTHTVNIHGGEGNICDVDSD